VIAALLHLSMEVTEPLGLKVAPQDLEFAEQGSSFILPSPARVFQVDKPVPRDGRIRRLMLAVHEAESRGNGVDMAWKELNQAIPFYFLQGPMGRFSNALGWYWKRDPGFMDELSLTMTASDLGSGNYAAAQMSVAQLGKFLLQINVPPVLNAYMIRGKPFFFSGASITARQLQQAQILPLNDQSSGTFNGAAQGVSLDCLNIANVQDIQLSGSGTIPLDGSGLNFSANGRPTLDWRTLS